MLRLYMFAVGHGDSLLIQLPRSGKASAAWGIVDCNVTTSEGRVKTPVLDFLADQAVDRIEFLCLSHPHRDHFKGLYSIVERYEEVIQQYWDYGLDLNHVLRTTMFDPEGKSEYRSLRKWALRKSKEDGSFWRPVCNYNSLLYRGRGVEISALGPSMDDLRAVERAYVRLAKAIWSRDDHKIRQCRVDANVLSGIVRIRYGKTTVILCGDAPAQSLETVIANSRRYKRRLSCQVVKVPHHGSRSSSSDTIWSALTARTRTVALISNGNRYDLPHADVIRTIDSHGALALCTRDIGICREATRFADVLDCFGAPVGPAFSDEGHLRVDMSRTGSVKVFDHNNDRVC